MCMGTTSFRRRWFPLISSAQSPSARGFSARFRSASSAGKPVEVVPCLQGRADRHLVGHDDEHRRATGDRCQAGEGADTPVRVPVFARTSSGARPRCTGQVPQLERAAEAGDRQAVDQRARASGCAPSAAACSSRARVSGATCEPRASPLPSSRTVPSVGTPSSLSAAATASRAPSKVAGRSRRHRGQPEQRLGEVVVARLQGELDELGDGRRLDPRPARARLRGPWRVRRRAADGDPAAAQQPGQVRARPRGPGRARARPTRAHPAGVDRQRADRATRPRCGT